MTNLIKNSIFLPPTRTLQEYVNLIDIPCYCQHGVVRINYRRIERAKGTIIFSHGNAMDLNFDCQNLARALSEATQCNVLIYDYCGYGIGKLQGQIPSEACCLANVTSCYEWLVNRQWQTPDRIWVMGQSLGCVPSNWLAANKPIAGLILISPFKSLRAMAHIYLGIILTNVFGLFVNINGFANDNMAKYISCKTLLIHGTMDQLVPIQHSIELSELYKGRVEKLWLSADHNNIFSDHWPTIIEKIKNFQMK